MSDAEYIEQQNAYKRSESELATVIAVSEQKVQRLAADIFSNTSKFENGMRKLMPKGVEHVISVLASDTVTRHRYFGSMNDGWLSGKKHLARASMQELPDALRELDRLNKEQVDISRARLAHYDARRERSPARSQADAMSQTMRKGRRT